MQSIFYEKKDTSFESMNSSRNLLISRLKQSVLHRVEWQVLHDTGNKKKYENKVETGKSWKTGLFLLKNKIFQK